MNNISQSVNTEYAGFWIRIGASLIDSVWQVIVLGVIGRALFGDALLDAILSGNPLAGGLPMILFQNLVPALIIIPFWVLFGATPAKILLNIKIVRASDGGNIGLGRSIVRFLAYIPTVLTLGLGLLWVAFDKRKQGLHDKIAGTVVIKTKNTN